MSEKKEEKKETNKEIAKAVAAARPHWTQKGHVWYLHDKDGRIFGDVRRTSSDVVEATYGTVNEKYIDIHSAREALMARMVEEIITKAKAKT